jgi:2-C-methyl-D-erythritol 4-phosphate cytidylyltransferase
MARFGVVLPAAGQSARLTGFRKKKPFVELKGRPVWVRTAEHFLDRDDVVQTVIVIAGDDMDWFREKFRANLAFMDITVVAGGSSRAESVRNGIQALSNDADHIVVHDAARPLLTSKWIDQILAAGVQYGAAIPGLGISSTVKRLNPDTTIAETVDRSRLVMAQTPQVFERTILENAFRVCRDWQSATDEASLAEQAGVPVHVIDGWAMNLKITTPEDFKLAELFVNALPRDQGLKNLHPFADENFR